MKTGKSEYPSVHRGILLAALAVLAKKGHPAAYWYSAEDAVILAEEVVKPDGKGDRQRGSGYHYYCAVKPSGKPASFAEGDYYRNGRGKKAPSARTMFEEEYVAALQANAAQHREDALRHLGRAAHMLADVCCPPHSCGLTYLTRYARYHKRFETLAAKYFWGAKDGLSQEAAIQRAAESIETEISTASYRMLDSAGAADLFNGLAQRSADSLPAVLGKEESALLKAVQAQLSLAVGETAALLAAFAAHSDDVAI